MVNLCKGLKRCVGGKPEELGQLRQQGMGMGRAQEAGVADARDQRGGFGQRCGREKPGPTRTGRDQKNVPLGSDQPEIRPCGCSGRKALQPRLCRLACSHFMWWRSWPPVLGPLLIHG